MSFAAIFEGMFYILFFAWAIAVFAASIASAVAGGALLFRLGIGGIIPDMPYLSAAVFGVCLLSFAVLLSAVAYYSFAYTKQIVRVSIRWHKSVMSGNTLPPLPLNPQFSPKQKRRLRSVLLLSLSVFATTMVLGAILSMILSGALGFWHAWGWFVA